MTNPLIYLFQVTLVFVVLYSLYRIVLHRLTFYKINRLILLLLIPISLVLPIADTIFPSVSFSIAEMAPVLQNITIDHTNTITMLQKPVLDGAL